MKTMKSNRVTSILFACLRPTLGRAMKSYFNIEYHNDAIKDLNAPFVVLGNHTNNLDPFFMAVGIKVPVHFVASDEYFRNPVLRFLLRLIGAIPKAKLMSDVGAVNSIINVIESGGVIAIYPEGRRNWDGTTLDILLPTAKLIKHLGIPVAVALSTGAYLSWPRWAKGIRRGKINIKYNVILNKKEIEDLTVKDIHSIISKALYHNEYEEQRKLMNPYKGKNSAERLELFLYVCPHCVNIGSLKSEGNRLFCRECGHEVAYDEYGFLKGKDRTYFDNPGDWNNWQTEWMREKIKKHISRGTADMDMEHISEICEASWQEGAAGMENISIIEDSEVLLKKGGKLIPLKDFAQGHIELYSDRLKFTGSDGKELCFNLKKIHGINVQYNSLFEFYYENALYRFIFNIKHTSAYKWVQVIQLIREESKKR